MDLKAPRAAAAGPRWRGLTGHGWTQLPREARDTLFLLGVIAWTVVPHLTHLPGWCAALVGTTLLWRAALAWRSQPLPGRAWVLATLALATGLTLWREGTLFGKEPGVLMLVLLMGLKTLELRARRDALVTLFLGFFLVLTHYLYSQSLLTALHTLVAVWGLLTALVLAHMPGGRPALARAAGLSARAAAWGLPVMVVLFVLFPRIGPLWGLPQDAAGRTGLSGTLRLGGIAQVANDDAIALRVRFLDPRTGTPSLDAAPSPGELYFRGPVLGRFDGVEWTRSPNRQTASGRSSANLRLLGPSVAYEVTLEPSRLPMVPLLEATPDLPGSAPVIAGVELEQRGDLQWQADRPLDERAKFLARAWLRFEHGPRRGSVALREWVDLPPGYNPRSLAWAAEVRRDPRYAQADGHALAARILSEINRERFAYTLEPGVYGRHAVDEFWFDRRMGFCEHYAAAFVVLMRALDVPARIVTGYQGADPFPLDGYWIVRQSNAHAWAEYWEADTGWVRVDPTAAVAPERIGRGRSLPPVPGLVRTAIQTINPQLAASLRGLWETLENRWNQAVLGYTKRQQFQLLNDLGFSAPDWVDLSYLLIGVVCAAALAAAAWAVWERQRKDPWTRLQQRIRRRLAAHGVTVQPHDPPRTQARQVRAVLGAPGEAVATALEALDALRYAPGGRPTVPRAWWRGFLQAAEPLPRRP